MASRRVPLFDGVSSSRRRVTQRGSSGPTEDTKLLLARAKEARAARAAARAETTAATSIAAAGRGALAGRRDVARRSAGLGERLAAAAAAASAGTGSPSTDLPASVREALYVGTGGQAFVAGAAPPVRSAAVRPWVGGLAALLTRERLTAAAATAGAADDAAGAGGSALSTLATHLGWALVVLLGALGVPGGAVADADGDVAMDGKAVPVDEAAVLSAAAAVMDVASWAPPSAAATVAGWVVTAGVQWGVFRSFTAALSAPAAPVCALFDASMAWVRLCLAAAAAARAGGSLNSATASGLPAGLPRPLVDAVLTRWATAVLAVPGLTAALSAEELSSLERAPLVREAIATLAAAPVLPVVSTSAAGAERPLAELLCAPERAPEGGPAAAQTAGRRTAPASDHASCVALYQSLLANLLHIGRGAWTGQDAAYTSLVVTVLVRLLCAIPGLTSRRQRGSGEPGGVVDLDAASGMLFSDSEDELEGEGGDSPAAAAVAPAATATTATAAPTGDGGAGSAAAPPSRGAAVGSLRADLLARLGPLLDERVVRRLFDMCLPRLGEGGVGSAPAPAAATGDTSAAAVCQLLTLLARRRRGGSNLLCNAVAFWAPATPAAPHVLLRLWAACTTVPLTVSSDGRTLVPAVSSLTSPLPSTLTLRPTAGPVLLLFCRAYAHLLSIQDEDELYELQRPLSLGSVCMVAATLKDTLVASVCPSALNLRWTAPAVTGAVNLLASTSVRAAVVDVLDRLHAADSRRRFVPKPDFWLAPSRMLDSTGFVRDAISAGAPPAAAGADDEAAAASSGADAAAAATPSPFVVDPVSAAVIDVDDRRSFRFGSWRRGPAPLDGGESKYGSGGAAAAAREPASAVRAAGDLLRLCPYAVPFATRVRVFHAWVAQRRIHSSASTWVTIRRARVFEDALAHLRNLPDTALRARVRVKFIDEHGLEEAGIDGGGVFKEFMHQLLATALSPSLYGLFKATDEQLLYPNPASSLIMEAHLEKFAFLGKMLAKAVFDGILVDVPLAGFVLAALLGRPYSPNDLRSLDPELHRNMMLVKRMDAADVDDMGLTFTAVDNEFGEAREVELVHGGRDLPVTSANRVEYIQRAAHHRLRQTREQTNAMRRGFGTLIDPRWSRLFGERELQLLMSGTRGVVDVADLRAATVYGGGYTSETPVVTWFWETVAELPADLQAALLLFVTSSPRAPLLGFRYLDPPFTISRAHGSDRLPSASTCMNLLKLPEYGDARTVAEKLTYALRSNAGFDLS